jgi:arabinose-5-phosphate isomerase
MHRTPRILGVEAKAILRQFPGGAAEQVHVGGVVLNHLGWAAALGLPVGIFGKQAGDENGRLLRRAMDRLGIERNLVLDGSVSSFAHIFVDDEGGRVIYMAPGATSETTPEHIREHHANFIARARRVTTEVSQLPLATVHEVLRIAREAGAETIVDLDVPPSDAVPELGDQATLEAVLQAADLIKPSLANARELVPEAGDDALAIAEAVRVRFGCRAVIVTEGKAGCAIAEESESLRVPAHPVKEVLDTTGAGDAFLGGLLVALEEGLTWSDAGRLANACGAACVESLGAFPEDPEAARARVLELYDGAPLQKVSRADLRPLPAAEVAVGSPPLECLDVALEELAALRGRLGASDFDRAIEMIRDAESKGARVHVTGIGKPEHVARYAASLLSSTGTPASFLHGTEAVHGSAGQVVAGDVVIAVSNSGETEEILRAVEAVGNLGARILAVTGDTHSALARRADEVLDAGTLREGGGLGFAPRASVAAEVLVLAALSAGLEAARGFTRADYNARHPSGTLGRKSRP